MIEKAKIAFEKYIDEFDKSVKGINLKYNHSYAVMDLMAELSFRLNLSKEDMELAKVIGLLHDIGRFYQLKESKSFDDSKLDHAEVAIKYLFDENHIRDFVEEDKYDEIIKKAIHNHNKHTIEKGLNDKELLFSKMIRDMDKVDIFKQQAINYDIVFDSKEITTEVLKEFSENKSIDRDIMKSKTDFTLQVLSFVFDINFNESYDILVSTDNFDLYLSMVDVKEDSEKLWKKVREVCFDKINKGIGD